MDKNANDVAERRPLDVISGELDALAGEIEKLERRRGELMIEHDAEQERMNVIPRFI